MILTFVTLTDDINKVPVWECEENTKGTKVSCFIKTSAFPKRIMLMGPNSEPPYKVSETTEVRPGVFVSKIELPYTYICVAGDDLRPFIGGYDPNAPHKNVVVIQIDRAVYTYLESGVGADPKESLDTDTVIINTFHAKSWMGCIAVLGEDFERGKHNPPRMVGMYIDYAIDGAPRSKMLHELHIKGNPKGISITDGLVEGEKTAKRLLVIHKRKKKQSFRMQSVQRLSNLVIIPESMKNAKAIFDESPADYLSNSYGIRFIPVPVDEGGAVIETDDVKKNVLSLFEKRCSNRNRSVIFCNCRPSESFFQLNLNYIFVATIPKKTKRVSYSSVICP